MNWQTFKSLYELYTQHKTRNRPTLISDPVFKYHILQTKELLVTRKEITLVKPATFTATFQKKHLANFNVCSDLLTEIGENIPQCKFEVEDILVLDEMKRQMESGVLTNIRQQIIDAHETRRGVSLMFFKNEKHLDSSEALERAVKTILQIEVFADDRDAQYLYTLQCLDPKIIVLCENLYFLKMPEKPRKHHIELWYAGGRNIDKLKYTPKTSLPIYYLCDWDHDGLDIYKSVKTILPQITLLTPNGDAKDIAATEHKSLWRTTQTPENISGLPPDIFSGDQKKLIEKLIKDNTWIVEESNDLLKLLQVNSISNKPA